MSPDAALAASYDEVPYEIRAFTEAHPDRLAVSAALFGLEPTAITSARVLEIGCAGGGNLIPIALGLPEARCVGIDLSPRQVASARSLANQVGVNNVELKAMDLLDLDASFGTFDYILCHGVYSWVSEPVRRKLMDVCRENLAPGGLAVVGYNVLPGWHARLAVRELLRMFAGDSGDPRRRAARARAVLDDLVRSLPAPGSPYARKLKDEAEALRSAADRRLVHEFLDIHNAPVYYHQFVAHARSAGLAVVADARYRGTAGAQPEAIGRTLTAAAGEDAVRREQYLDLLRDRAFRRSILCHAEARPAATASPEGIPRLRASALAVPGSPRVDLRPSALESFEGLAGQGRLTSRDPLTKALLLSLAGQVPRSLPFADLAASALALLDSVHPRPDFDRDPAAVARALLDGFGSGFFDLHTQEPAFSIAAGDRPLASPLARVQLAAGEATVTNLGHRTVRPSDFDRFVLRHLDGRRDRAGLVAAMIDAIRAGEFAIRDGIRPIDDPAILRDILGRSLEPSLARSARSALLLR